MTQIAWAQGLTAEEQHLATMINGSRTQAGLQPFVIDSRLSKVSRSHSHDMASNWFFGHNSPTTGDVFNRLRNAKIAYRSASQSIAYVRSPQAAHTSIMGCQLNRGNVLNQQFTHVGVGIIRIGHQMMVTETFMTSFMRSHIFSRPLWGQPTQQTQRALPSPWGATPATTQQPSTLTNSQIVTAQPAAQAQATNQCSLAGTWQGTIPDGMLRGRTVTFVFRSNGTATGTSGSITTNTRWVRQGPSAISINDVSANPNLAACPAGQTGQYNLSFSSDCNTVQVLNGSDVCRHRNLTLQGLQVTRSR